MHRQHRQCEVGCQCHADTSTRKVPGLLKLVACQGQLVGDQACARQQAQAIRREHDTGRRRTNRASSASSSNWRRDLVNAACDR